jgi:hypothetical protein
MIEIAGDKPSGKRKTDIPLKRIHNAICMRGRGNQPSRFERRRKSSVFSEKTEIH